MSGGGRDGELWDVVRDYRQVFIVVLCVSAILNVLLLGGSL